MDCRQAGSNLSSPDMAARKLIERSISACLDLAPTGVSPSLIRLVDTNEGKDYMDEIRRIASSLSLTESSNLARFDTESVVALKRVWSVTIIANSVLLVLAVG